MFTESIPRGSKETSTDSINVTKRDGHLEPINIEKIHRVLIWAAEGLEQVSVSQIELQAHLQFFDGISTAFIHQTLIKSAADLISEQAPDYQYIAARLALFQLRKKAFGQFEPPSLIKQIQRGITQGFYDKHLLDDYSVHEIDELNSYINHSRDFNFAYAAISQLEGKYLLQNRVTGTIYESPQFLYMLVAMALFSKEQTNKNALTKYTRLEYVKQFYDAISLFKISLPTPIMSGVRTPTRQFSSCVLIECDDSLNSINATASAIVNYISARSGIGVNVGAIRAQGSEIRKGEAFHTGCIPFYKYFQAAVKSCSQGGVRGGAATLFYPLWHLDVESLLVLKNNRGVEENRVRHLDYAVQINQLFYKRLLNGENITLFSPDQVPDLYQAFFKDQVQFEQLYLQAESNPSLRKKKINAVTLFSLLMQERASTGRIYIQHVDHCNEHGAFNPNIAPIRQSNLCMEITTPTKPLQHLLDDQGEISLCTLSAFNLGAINQLSELEQLAHLTVRALDNLLDYQNYLLPAAQIGGLARRNLGIGVINFAYYLAKNDKNYCAEINNPHCAFQLTHKTFEAIQYYLLKASNELAKQKGRCAYFSETKYAQGILPIDTYQPYLDKICNPTLQLNWEALRHEIKQHGLRNSTLSALMPSETSSQIANATNGIEPPRGLVTIKASKDGILKQVVPEIKHLKNNYQCLWDLPNNQGYLTLVAIMQKFIDQSISCNTSYDPSKFKDHKVPMQQLLNDLLFSYQLGIKTLYYHNTRDGSGSHFSNDMDTFNTNQQKSRANIMNDNLCDSGACAI